MNDKCLFSYQVYTLQSVSLGLMDRYLGMRSGLSVLDLVVYFTWLDGLLFVYEECPFSYPEYTW